MAINPNRQVEGIIAYMGLLRDLHHLTQHTQYLADAGSSILAEYLPQNYSEAYGKDLEEVKHLYESAKAFGFIQVNLKGEAIVSPKKGRLLLRKKFGVSTGLINEYTSNNSWVNLLLGGVIGAALTYVVQLLLNTSQ